MNTQQYTVLTYSRALVANDLNMKTYIHVTDLLGVLCVRNLELPEDSYIYEVLTQFVLNMRLVKLHEIYTELKLSQKHKYVRSRGFDLRNLTAAFKVKLGGMIEKEGVSALERICSASEKELVDMAKSL